MPQLLAGAYLILAAYYTPSFSMLKSLLQGGSGCLAPGTYCGDAPFACLPGLIWPALGGHATDQQYVTN